MPHFTNKELAIKRTCPICGHRGYRYIELCTDCRIRTAPKRPSKKPCKICGKVGQRENDICQECISKSLSPKRGYYCECGNKKDWNSDLCRVCYDKLKGRINWTKEKIDFLIENYPAYGAAWCSEKLSIPHRNILFAVNRFHILLSKESTKEIVNSKAAEYMREHNPSHLPGASERISKESSRPENIARLIVNIAKMQKEKPSGLEKRLHKILDDLGVSFEYAVLIKPKFVVDVRIGRLIIEADGEYWHGHPRYEPLTERQERQQARDTARNKYLAACGYFVERIWDRDVTIENVTSILKKHNII